MTASAVRLTTTSSRMFIRLSPYPSDLPTLFAFIEQHPLAAVVTSSMADGLFAMSQNRSDADITGVIRGLGASDEPEDHAVAAIVSDRRPTG